VKQIIDNGCNLDIKNPTAKEGLEHLPPHELVEGIVAKERRILQIMGEIKTMLAEGVK
jgi:type I restriction enzyme M protein